MKRRQFVILLLELLLKLKLIDYLTYPSGLYTVENEGVLQTEVVIEVSWKESKELGDR